MEKELFVEKLNLLAPSPEDFKQYNLTEEYIQNIISSYKCLVKTKNNNSYTNDLLLSLLNSYDCSKVEIGLVRFLENPIEKVGFYQVGNIDLEILAIDKITSQVEVIDHDNLEYVIWECASNSKNFLDALLVSAEYFVSQLKNSSEEDYAIISKYVNYCTEIAGGEQYMAFYKMLFE